MRKFLAVLLIAGGCAQNDEANEDTELDVFEMGAAEDPLAPPSNGVHTWAHAEVIPGVYYYGDHHWDFRAQGIPICEIEWITEAVRALQDCSVCEWAFEVRIHSPIKPLPPAPAQYPPACQDFQLPSDLYDHVESIGYDHDTGRMYVKDDAGDWRPYTRATDYEDSNQTFQTFDFQGRLL